MPATADLFRRFPNRMLVETGTWRGDGVQAALDAGFSQVTSIELSQELYAQAEARFHGDSRVRLLQGASEDLLPQVLAEVDYPLTFWLDAHYSAGDTASGKHVSPILQELAAIAAHPVKTHTILIDDLRLFGSEFPVTRLQLLDAVMAIHAYRLEFADSPAAPADILVATPP